MIPFSAFSHNIFLYTIIAYTEINVFSFSGPAGSRTPVRTRKPYAFYTLIPAFIFVRQQDLDHQLPSYPLKRFIKGARQPLTIPDLVCTA